MYFDPTSRAGARPAPLLAHFYGDLSKVELLFSQHSGTMKSFTPVSKSA
jgi:hypothetical protein